MKILWLLLTQSFLLAIVPIESKLSPHPYIIGGGTAYKGEFPFQVSIQSLKYLFFWRHDCGGVLITEWWVLTSASCTDPWWLRVAAGKTDLSHTEDGEQIAYISKKHQHPLSVKGSGKRQNDIALLLLRSKLRYSDTVRPARLPTIQHPLLGTAIVSGWGITSPEQSWFNWSGRWSDVLQHTLVLTEECENDLCVRAMTDGNAPCKGDVGGGLVRLQEDGTYLLLGILTWTPVKCGDATVISEAANIYNYSDFISSTMD